MNECSPARVREEDKARVLHIVARFPPFTHLPEIGASTPEKFLRLIVKGVLRCGPGLHGLNPDLTNAQEVRIIHSTPTGAAFLLRLA